MPDGCTDSTESLGVGTVNIYGTDHDTAGRPLAILFAEPECTQNIQVLYYSSESPFTAIEIPIPGTVPTVNLADPPCARSLFQGIAPPEAPHSLALTSDGSQFLASIIGVGDSWIGDGISISAQDLESPCDFAPGTAIFSGSPYGSSTAVWADPDGDPFVFYQLVVWVSACSPLPVDGAFNIPVDVTISAEVIKHTVSCA
jgi:hypothetical protein